MPKLSKPKLSARAKKRNALVIAAQDKWQAEQDRRQLADLKERMRKEEDSLLLKFINDVDSLMLSNRAVASATEIGLNGVLVRFEVPFEQLRKIVRLMRERLSAMKQEGK